MKKNFTTLLELLFLAGASMPLSAAASQGGWNAWTTPLSVTQAVNGAENVVSTRGMQNLDILDNEKWCGYFNGDFEDNTVTLGVETTGAYDCCIKIPATDEVMGKGKTIEGISFSFPSRYHIDSVYVWISEELPSSPQAASITYQQVKKSDLNDLRSLSRKSNEARFDKPYMMGDKDIYVGYSFVVTKAETAEDKSPVLITKYPQNTAKNALFFNAPGEEWTDMSGYPFGNLAMRVLMSRKSTQNAVSIQPRLAADLAGKTGTVENLTVSLKNEGEQPCNNFSYVVANGSQKYEEQTVTLEEPVSGLDKVFEYTIPVPINEKSGKDTLMIQVTKVNSVNNESVSHTQCNGNMFALSKVADHNVFIEYFVGTWDGHSPRAYISMDKISKKYGDRAVIASVHAGNVEAMECADYTKMTYYYKGTTGFPTSFVDRTINDIYPYWGEELMSDFGFEQCFLKMYNKVALAEILVDSKLSDDNKVLNVTSTTNFLCENPTGDYGVGYVLLADSLTGTGKGWEQENQLVDFKGSGIFDNDTLFNWWMDGEKVVKGFVYNNVAIAAQGMLTKGLDQSLSAPFNESTPQTHSVTFDLSTYPLIQDIRKLSVCAVVFDRKTGCVVNSDKAFVKVSTAIEDVIVPEVAVKEVARYSVGGQRLLVPTKGVNFVKYSDGSVKKVYVR